MTNSVKCRSEVQQKQHCSFTLNPLSHAFSLFIVWDYLKPPRKTWQFWKSFYYKCSYPTFIDLSVNYSKTKHCMTAKCSLNTWEQKTPTNTKSLPIVSHQHWWLMFPSEMQQFTNVEPHVGLKLRTNSKNREQLCVYVCKTSESGSCNLAAERYMQKWEPHPILVKHTTMPCGEP